MTRAEAGEVVAYLNAVFPREALEPETVVVWVVDLMELRRPDAAMQAARGIGRSRDRFPSLRELRDAYAPIARRMEEAERPREIEAVTSGERELPASVREWLARGPREV